MPDRPLEHRQLEADVVNAVAAILWYRAGGIISWEAAHEMTKAKYRDRAVAALRAADDMKLRQLDEAYGPR